MAIRRCTPLSFPHVTFLLNLVLLLATVALGTLLSAQEQLQMNVPYRCPDGTYKVISRCATNARGGTICYWGNYEKNGNLSYEQFNVRGQMDGWLATCRPDKPAAGAQAGTAGAASRGQAAQAGQAAPPTLVATPTGRIAAGLNPPYLNDMPSVETVKSRIQGSDPTDTMERQVAVFNNLNAIIQHHRANANHSYDLTPDEVKVTGVYALAAYQMEEGYKKTHTAAEAEAFTRRHWQLEMDPVTYKEIDSKLLSATAVAENRANDAAALKQLQEHNEKTVRDQQEAIAKSQAAAQAATNQSAGLSNDPTAVATRRCLELGGGELECVGKGFGKGLMSMIGLDLDGITGPGRIGLMIAGTYRDPSGVHLTFNAGDVTIGACGKLVDKSLGYQIAKRGTSLVLQVANQPRPFTVVLGPDGNIAGQGATDVLGQIITGYRHWTVYTRRVSDNQIVGQHEESEPIYADKLERCSIAALRSAGPVPSGDLGNLLPALFAVVSGDRSGGNIKTYPAGPRMVGTYEGPGGLKIEFQPEGAIVDCQQAHAARPYTVENTATTINVTVGGTGSPIALTLQADQSLTGSGSAEVAGRLVTGMAGDKVNFQATRASCAVGKLTPAQPKKAGGLLSGM